MTSEYDVIVIGAGIAGCAAAKAFAHKGYQVLVIERSLTEPDRIVGELLQPGGVAALQRLGLGECLEGIDASPVKGYHIYWHGEEAPFWFCAAPNEPQPTGRTFHHGRFVSKLRHKIAAEGNITLMEGTVREILRDDVSRHVVGVQVTLKEDMLLHLRLHAHLTILADGPSSNFRSQFIDQQPSAKSRFWGLELIDANLPHYGYAYGVIGSGPPLLMYQISEKETRILIDILDSDYRQMGDAQGVREYIISRVLPTLPPSVQPSVLEAAKSGRLRCMPNSWLSSAAIHTPGIAILGDASNMRHPLTGGGMTVAIKDAILLAELLAPNRITSLSDRSHVAKAIRVFHWQRKWHASTINILAQTLYLLFVAEDPGLQIMQAGFVKYIQKGPRHFGEPVGIMGGLVENPLRLFYQFFCIAFYSIGLHVHGSGVLGLPFALLESCKVFWSAVAILMPCIRDELKG
ncbi:squalene epoxidase [Stachybotrys elegans]|uniref:Squalene monooxygenase n=1 Tax=Stachybotrys elegans TaxID=80388 RepID=A0A8K0SFG8_9HYPO|nr:squalene epoxidase [Stachybotrys elegans]